MTEGGNELLETVVVAGVLHDLLGESAELFLGRELTKDQKESNFEEGSLLSQLLDRVSSVLQDPLLSINETNSGHASDSVHVGRVE